MTAVSPASGTSVASSLMAEVAAPVSDRTHGRSPAEQSHLSALSLISPYSGPGLAHTWQDWARLWGQWGNWAQTSACASPIPRPPPRPLSLQL